MREERRTKLEKCHKENLISHLASLSLPGKDESDELHGRAAWCPETARL